MAAAAATANPEWLSLSLVLSATSGRASLTRVTLLLLLHLHLHLQLVVRHRQTLFEATEGAASVLLARDVLLAFNFARLFCRQSAVASLYQLAACKRPQQTAQEPRRPADGQWRIGWLGAKAKGHTSGNWPTCARALAASEKGRACALCEQRAKAPSTVDCR